MMKEGQTITEIKTVKIEVVVAQDKKRKEVVLQGVESGRKNSHYPEGNVPHY